MKSNYVKDCEGTDHLVRHSVGKKSWLLKRRRDKVHNVVAGTENRKMNKGAGGS